MIENEALDGELERAFRKLDALVTQDREGYWTARGILEKLRPLILTDHPGAQENSKPTDLQLS